MKDHELEQQQMPRQIERRFTTSGGAELVVHIDIALLPGQRTVIWGQLESRDQAGNASAVPVHIDTHNPEDAPG